MAVKIGTLFNDTLTGTLDNDSISGLAGDDNLFGLAGNDELNGDEGSDLLDGGAGNDSLYGDRLLDPSVTKGEEHFLFNRNARDTLIGGLDNDFLVGGGGADTLIGGAGNDILWGGYNAIEATYELFDEFFDENGEYNQNGYGNDLLVGGSGNDILHGDSITEDIRVYGYSVGGDDTLDGGSGDDFLEGGLGKNSLYGGSGNDTLFAGYELFDSRLPSADDSTLYGGSGNDYLEGGISNDLLDGGTGNDILSGGDVVYLEAGRNNDTLIGGSGDDLLNGGIGNDVLNGDSGNDVLICDILFDYYSEEGVVDTFTGGAGADQFILGDKYRFLYAPEQFLYEDSEPLEPLPDVLGEYVIITDFNPSQDVIQLVKSYLDEYGLPSEIPVKYTLGSTPVGLPQGTGIYIDQESVPFAIIQGVTDLSLDQSYFRFD